MTRVVIYDHEDMEPITIVEVPFQYLREIREKKRGPFLEIPVRARDERSAPMDTITPLEFRHFKIVRVEFARICKSDGVTLFWICTTRDGETALTLRAAFTPGQIGEIHEIEKQAFYAGLAAAMGR